MTKDFDQNLGASSICVHAGNEVASEGAAAPAVKAPIYMSNIYRLPTDGTEPDWSGIDSYIYSRNGNVNQFVLEEKLAKLENAEACVTLGSGVSALASTFFTFLSSGDHVVCSQVCYAAVNLLFRNFLPAKYDIEVSLVDTTDLEAVKNAVKPNTKLIHVETPGNPTTGISDLAEISKIAKEAGALLSVDGTFASPMCQSPLELGVDLLIHSMTKYINGHGDSLGGCVLGRKELIEKIKTEAMVNVGGVLSPFNAWLIARGMTTLPIRMKQINENAMEVAKFLENHEKVRFIYYPGLESHPQHELAKKQMHNGYSGMICFGLDGTEEQHYELLSHLKMIVHAVSLGDGESLIVYNSKNGEKMDLYPEEFRQGFYRFSIGLEDYNDIIADLGQALESVFN
ncbi:MAG: aminotransferase class I/II-fold pyridoxal phosphate-dependent enzyme [Tissierellaceae bacterium]|nr:aminotransferase class I/II-fold pyridoxal phosphate-dependent enzyme [Tissierellaceae bacterium]